jgi:hypothetical protein
MPVVFILKKCSIESERIPRRVTIVMDDPLFCADLTIDHFSLVSLRCDDLCSTCLADLPLSFITLWTLTVSVLSHADSIRKYPAPSRPPTSDVLFTQPR